jgi:hypothetical protein
MFIIRATGLDRPYLQIFREIRTDNSHSTHWAFTGVRLAARHFGEREAAAVVKARLVNLMLCTGRLEFARSLEIVEAIPTAPDAISPSPVSQAAASLAESDDAEQESRGLTMVKRFTRFVCGVVGCVLTLWLLSGCAGPKVAAEAAYRSQASSLGAGEVVAGVRVEWN